MNSCLSENNAKDIPLTEAFTNPSHAKATPLDVFKLARKAWLKSEGINISKIAAELEINRMTIYRWVGCRDQLIEEILWSFTEPLFRDCIDETPGTGVDHVIDVHRCFMINLVNFEPMMRYIRQYPLTIIQLQSTDLKLSDGRLILAAADHLRQQINNGYLKIPITPEKMAEMMVVTNRLLLYSAIIGNRKTAPAIEQACAIDRMMLMGAFIEISI